MIRVRLTLVTLLFYCSVQVKASELPTQGNPECHTKPWTKPIPKNETKSDGGYVKLSKCTDGRVFEKDDCFKLTCEGSASPHRKITWYRLLTNSPDSPPLSISQYWSQHYYYDPSTTLEGDNGVSSSLTIRKFNKGYEGLYFCEITNGDLVIPSPRVNLTLKQPNFGIGVEDVNPPPPSVFELYNITAIRVNSTSALITWNTKQRNGVNYCKMWRPGIRRSESFIWKLQVLEWINWTVLSSDPDYERIKMKDYYDTNKLGDQFPSLTKAQCTSRSYLLTGLSPSIYYKFQIMVEKIKRQKNSTNFEPAKKIAENGSYVHYFGKHSLPKIVYPTPLEDICQSYDPNICQATGNPPPRIQLLQDVYNMNLYKCLAENFHLDNFGKESRNYDMVDFYWNTSSCPQPTATSSPKPSCVAMQSHDTVCSQYISQSSTVYVPANTNITELEEYAEAAINQLVREETHCYHQTVRFICLAYLAPCYLDTPMPRTVCPQSCNDLKSQCDGEPFRRVQDQLPEWSSGSNCSSLKQTVAGSSPECIHLSAPLVEEEEYSDGSCLVGKGTTYSGNITAPGCMAWNDDKQIFYNISLFNELKSAESACRNPGGSGERPWCYLNFTSTTSSRWTYCDIPKCPSCEPVPEMCKDVYSNNSTVFYVKDNSYPMDNLAQDCFPNRQDRCYEVWKTIICHLAYPECVEAKEDNKLHTSMPLRRSYCNAIKNNITRTCDIPSTCMQSLFVHKLNEIDCSSLSEENGLFASDLVQEKVSPPPSGNPADNSKQNSNHQLAISIYVAAAVCLFSVVTIVAIIVGYCCCLYGSENSNSELVKPLDKPFDHPVFATMKMHYIDNPDYVKTSTEKDGTFAFKSLRPISKSKIHYIRDLGSGNFGLVYQGKVEGIVDGEEFTMAAIKTLREGTSAEGLKNFLHEAKLACQFNHENIIKLYGICMSEGFYCLVFEYMDLGDLNEFLRNSASSTQRRIMNPLDSSSRSRTESSLSNSPARLNTQQLISICHQIALGMEYFASLNHVHRDLATRNCLVSTGLVVKIGDFGMSQTLYHSDYYKQRGEQALPVRWMAPEAFIYGRFSTEGDVWSFGVVMWEVFSFAMQPYYGKMNDQVMNEVRRGHTLSRPDDCPESIFEIMRSCWQMEPHRRPSFSELVEELSNWKPTRFSTSTALESQGSIKDDMEDSLSLPSIQDKDLETSVFEECNMSGTEDDIAN